MGEILVYQRDAGTKGKSEPLTILDSYHPGSGLLTYYYWDDWMLSAHLFPKGETLPLAGAWAVRRSRTVADRPGATFSR